METIEDFERQVLEDWKERDPWLRDQEGFRKLFNQRYGQRLKALQKVEAQQEREANRAIEELVMELTRPIIVWPSAWSADNPGWLIARIRIDRLIGMMKGEKGLATLSEVVYYMLPRSLEATMDSDFAQIYLWCSREVLTLEGKEVPDEYIERIELTDWQRHHLDRLRRWIYEKSVERYREKRRVERRGLREDDEAVPVEA